VGDAEEKGLLDGVLRLRPSPSVQLQADQEKGQDVPLSPSVSGREGDGSSETQKAEDAVQEQKTTPVQETPPIRTSPRRTTKAKEKVTVQRAGTRKHRLGCPARWGGTCFCREEVSWEEVTKPTPVDAILNYQQNEMAFVEAENRLYDFQQRDLLRRIEIAFQEVWLRKTAQKDRVVRHTGGL
jgi:hypothetical protein